MYGNSVVNIIAALIIAAAILWTGGLNPQKKQSLDKAAIEEIYERALADARKDLANSCGCDDIAPQADTKAGDDAGDETSAPNGSEEKASKDSENKGQEGSF